MSRRRTRLVLLVAASVGVALLAWAPVAQASGILGSGIGPDLGPNLNPLPSIGELLNEVVNGLFGTLLAALTPGFLKHADIHTLEWLVALPNVADTSVWPTVGRLEANMMWVAGAILPTTLLIATIRDTALSLTFRAHPGNALLRVIGAVFWLVLYRFSFENGVAFVNVLTHTMLSWSIVAQGLHRTVLVMFGASVIAGLGGAFFGLLGLVALVLALSLFALKVLILVVTAILFVSGPLFIALTPLPTIGDLARGWLLALVSVCLIPVGWCIIFAVAGAISLDVTNLGGGAHIGSRVIGAFAALVTFYIAWKWPLMVSGHVRNALGGLGVRPGGAPGGRGAVSNGTLAVKAQRARVGLQAAMLAGGRGLGLAAGQLGAPRGGLVGLAGRQARPHVAAAAASGAIAVGRPSPRPRPTPGRERVARAGDKLRETPTRMREAWRAASEAPTPPASAGRGGSGAGRGRAGTGASPGGRPRRASRGSGRGPGPSRRPPRSGGPGAAPREGGSGPPAHAARKGSGGSKRPPVVPLARPAQGGTPGLQGASSRSGQSGRGGAARARASAAAQPQSGGGGRAGSPRPAQGPGSTGQRPRPAASDSRSVRSPARRRKGRPSRARVPRTPRKGRKG